MERKEYKEEELFGSGSRDSSKVQKELKNPPGPLDPDVAESVARTAVQKVRSIDRDTDIDVRCNNATGKFEIFYRTNPGRVLKEVDMVTRYDFDEGVSSDIVAVVDSAIDSILNPQE